MRKILQPLLLVPIISSCFTVNYKRFTFYKQSPTKPLVIETAGLYYAFEKATRYDTSRNYWGNIYFFYEDGSVYETIVGVKDSSVDELRYKLPDGYYDFVENNIQTTGAFKITGDTLKIQRFAGTGQKGIYATDIMEEYFVINKNTNSLTSLQSYCKWCAPNFSGFDKKTGLEKDYVSRQYNFLPLPSKPDSSKMRYKHKRWYKTEL